MAKNQKTVFEGESIDDALFHTEVPKERHDDPVEPDLDDPEQRTPDPAVTRNAMRCVRCRRPISESQRGKRARRDGIDRLPDEKLATEGALEHNQQDSLEEAIAEFRRLKLHGIADMLESVSGLAPDHLARLAIVDEAYDRVAGVGMEGSDEGLDLLEDSAGEHESE